MRPDQIKFRGKLKKDGKWVYGDLLRNVDGDFAVVQPFGIHLKNYCDPYEVNPDTIGQFTGLRDNNGREIYEGDIVRVGTNYCSYFYKVVFSIGCFRLADKDGDVWFNLNEDDAEVCGNIFDNKYLLED